MTSVVGGSGRYCTSCEIEPRAIRFDPTDSNRIMVGTDDAGIVASLDGGATWTSVPGSTRVTDITDFFFDEVQRDIVVSSYGRGLWKLAWQVPVSLTASVTAPALGSGSTVTATTNVDVSGSSDVIEIYSVDTGQLVASCSTGSACSINVIQITPAVRNFIAYVAPSATSQPPPNAHGSSNVVSVGWGLSVSITANPTSLPRGQSTKLTATSNLDLTRSTFSISTLDENTKARAFCSVGLTQCTGSVSKPDAITDTFTASICNGGTAGSCNAVAVSNQAATVTWN